MFVESQSKSFVGHVFTCKIGVPEIDTTIKLFTKQAGWDTQKSQNHFFLFSPRLFAYTIWDTEWIKPTAKNRGNIGVSIHYVRVVQNYGTRKTPLRRAFANLFAPFRAPAESGHEIMIRFSFTYNIGL